MRKRSQKGGQGKLGKVSGRRLGKDVGEKEAALRVERGHIAGEGSGKEKQATLQAGYFTNAERRSKSRENAIKG
ncbi:hypothetical protein E2C01_099706 [Portunus trituberculatus]|uniref:Uncharacterized protein n=1 Tax=Portunus trituberculatus TaxID=210409 RepID=A0A5B7KFL1_PORTR|nr:hypothetical protein [Portunus trituberculatus]